MTSSEPAHRLHDGPPVFGTLIVSPSPRWPDVVRGCGPDFVFIDAEHILIKQAAGLKDARVSGGELQI